MTRSSFITRRGKIVLYHASWQDRPLSRVVAKDDCCARLDGCLNRVDGELRLSVEGNVDGKRWNEDVSWRVCVCGGGGGYRKTDAGCRGLDCERPSVTGCGGAQVDVGSA